MNDRAENAAAAGLCAPAAGISPLAIRPYKACSKAKYASGPRKFVKPPVVSLLLLK